MINHITFMGREGYTSKPVKQAVSKTYEYLSPSAVFEDTVSKTKDSMEFFNDYSPIKEELTEKVRPHFNEVKDVAADEIAESYRAAHGII